MGFASLLLLKNQISSCTNSDAATHQDELFACVDKMFHRLVVYCCFELVAVDKEFRKSRFPHILLLLTGFYNEFFEIGFFGVVTDLPRIIEAVACSLATLYRVCLKSARL